MSEMIEKVIEKNLEEAKRSFLIPLKEGESFLCAQCGKEYSRKEYALRHVYFDHYLAVELKALDIEEETLRSQIDHYEKEIREVGKVILNGYEEELRLSKEDLEKEKIEKLITWRIKELYKLSIKKKLAMKYRELINKLLDKGKNYEEILEAIEKEITADKEDLINDPPIHYSPSELTNLVRFWKYEAEAKFLAEDLSWVEDLIGNLKYLISLIKNLNAIIEYERELTEKLADGINLSNE